MNNHKEEFEKEQQYLRTTVDVINRELNGSIKILESRKHELITARREMWENSSHTSLDLDKLIEANQYLSEINVKTSAYENIVKLTKKYEQMRNLPYFGRFDFLEDGCSIPEKIYIGLYNLIDPDTQDILVYDWRAPISSMFYQFELGDASYTCPNGKISGKILLKRQYKIKNAQLEYFFDCNVPVNDAILQNALSQMTTPKMRAIVETIQREQDSVIRDVKNSLVMVQGVAGSGKTSVALHRIAFLIYNQIETNMLSKNILIISPNKVFTNYISEVLPSLGEDNVEQLIFEDYAKMNIDKNVAAQSRNEAIEFLLSCTDKEMLAKTNAAIQFKNSKLFAQILNNLILYFERRLISFEDIYYDGEIIFTRQYLKNRLLNDKSNTPLAKRLEKLEVEVIDKLRTNRKRRLAKLENFASTLSFHRFEARSFARMLSFKETRSILEKIRKSTTVNFYHLYKLLFSDRATFAKLTRNITLPEHIDSIVASSCANTQNNQLSYEDLAPLMYLKYKLGCINAFLGIKQVVIDEAQDYSILHYNVFKLMFPNAQYTVLGDINQSLEFDVHISLYDDIVGIFDKKLSTKIFLNKSYRTSFEIFAMCQKILGVDTHAMVFKRHENPPEVRSFSTEATMDKAIINCADKFISDGFTSVAILCKTMKASKALYDKLSKFANVSLIASGGNHRLTHGITVMPIYVSKGLEFDAVIVYNASAANFSSQMDKKMLYVACTRALHRLALYSLGSTSRFIKK